MASADPTMRELQRYEDVIPRTLVHKRPRTVVVVEVAVFGETVRFETELREEDDRIFLNHFAGTVAKRDWSGRSTNERYWPMRMIFRREGPEWVYKGFEPACRIRARHDKSEIRLLKWAHRVPEGQRAAVPWPEKTEYQGDCVTS